MKWHYSGEVTVHRPDGSMDIEQVDTVVDLPDQNVEVIRNFLNANRSLILGYKYNPPSGEAPWGDVASQSELHRMLANQMSDDEWASGVTDKQVKAFLVRFYHHVVENAEVLPGRMAA